MPVGFLRGHYATEESISWCRNASTVAPVWHPQTERGQIKELLYSSPYNQTTLIIYHAILATIIKNNYSRADRGDSSQEPR